MLHCLINVLLVSQEVMKSAFKIKLVLLFLFGKQN